MKRVKKKRKKIKPVKEYKEQKSYKNKTINLNFYGKNFNRKPKQVCYLPNKV